MNAQPDSLKPPHDILGAVPYETPLWMLVGLVLLALLCLATAYWLWKRRPLKPAVAAPEPVPALGPEDWLKELMLLAPPSPFDAEAREAYYFELTRILKNFLQFDAKKPLVDMTTEELMAEFPRLSLSLKRDQREDVQAFVLKADQIKFAHSEVGRTEAEQDRALVEKWARGMSGGLRL